MITMKEDAMIKSANGVVPFEEVNTLGGEFGLDEIVPVPPPAPEEITEEDLGGIAGKKEPAPSKEIEV